MDTHEVFNQTPPFGDVNLVATDQPLLDALAANGVDPEAEGLVGLRRALGHRRSGSISAGSPTRTRRSCAPTMPRGYRIDVVEFHPAYHALMRGQHGGRPACLDLGRADRSAPSPCRVARAARLS